MQIPFIGLGTGTLCVSKWFQSRILWVAISALTEPDWVILKGNHAIMGLINPNSQKMTMV